MSRTIFVVRYDADPALSLERRFAVQDSFATMRSFAIFERNNHDQFLARRLATQCRDLITAFGVRRQQRLEITEAMMADVRSRTQHA